MLDKEPEGWMQEMAGCMKLLCITRTGFTYFSTIFVYLPTSAIFHVMGLKPGWTLIWIFCCSLILQMQQHLMGGDYFRMVSEAP